MSSTTEIILDPVEASRLAGLRYVSDAKPGFTRKRRGKSFQYFDADGKPIRDKDEIARIKSLVVPPAWTDVWICPRANGHLQATGRDARGRKQSRYHPRWREVRDENKYERMKLFGETLPTIRSRVEKDLALPGLPRDKVLATIVRLLETTFIRVGNEEYAKENHSYGLTTMRNKHVDVEGSTVRFKFKGKSGKNHNIDLNDRRLARIVKRCLDLPGYELFQYIDDDESLRAVDSSDVNDYLRSITEQQFTAKDFRTWAGTNLAALALRELESFDSQAKAKRNVVQAVEAVSKMLGNTPAICRKCYIHPAVFDGYLDGSLLQALKKRADEKLANPRGGLKAEEAAVMGFLSRQLAAADRLPLRQKRRASIADRGQQRKRSVVVVGDTERNRDTSAIPP
jgi:DNA topoisomerase I